MILKTQIKHWAAARCVGGLLPLVLAAGTPAVLCAQEAESAETVVAIEVIGAQKQTAETVIFKSGIKVGDDLRNLDLAKITEKMWVSGSFDDIKFEVQDDKDKGGKNGKKLIIRIRERPIIKEVDYRGGTELGLTNLKDKVKEKKLTITPDSLYDPDAARKIKDLIVDQAAEKGFRNPVVDVNLEIMGPGVSRLVFDIKEGGKVRIYSLKFRGNKIISSSQLARAMEKTRRHWSFSWLTSHDLLVDKNLEEDLKHVKETYWRKGYKDVFVGQPTIEVQDFTTAKQKKKNIKREREAKSPKYDLRATLVVPVLEGEQYYEGTFKVEGNEKVFKEKYFREKYAEMKRDNRSYVAKFLNLKPSTADQPAQKAHPFDLDALNKAMDKIKEGYSNASYILYRAEKKLETREEAGRRLVDTTLKVDEGEPFTIRRIEFEGNTTTKDKVLRRSLRLREGDPFSAEEFKDSFTGLGQLGFFDVKGQEPKVDLVPNKPQVDITIKGEEAGVNELLFQGGYGQLFGFSLGASFSTKNLGGGGESLALSFNGGQFSKTASVSYVEPFVLDLPYSFSASISNGTTDYDASRVGADNAYKQFTRSLGLNTGTRLSTFFPQSRWAFFTTYSVGYTFSIIRIEGGRNFYFRDTTSQLTSTFNQSIEFNTVNHPYKPTQGTRFGMSLEYGGWQFGGDRPSLRANWNFSKYANAGERHIFAANLSYGYIRNLGQDELPLYQYYRPGGENSIRGYKYGQVGSLKLDNFSNPVVVGGNKQFVANLEYQFKVADPFRLVLFYDAGNAWAQGTKIFSSEFVSYTLNNQTIAYRNPTLLRSAGVELRFFLPISPAPLRLIWSRKLNPYPFDPEGQNDFQFSIGTTF
ncbi:MAG: outer membrane protein assembly factor BamA [Holophagaceae bacterium]|nr:outer membrane protein assembly factor BamA [Holophagaceae bacterium]